LFYYRGDPVQLGLDYAPSYGQFFIVNDDLAADQDTQDAPAKGQDLKDPLLSGQDKAFGLAFKNHLAGTDYGDI